MASKLLFRSPRRVTSVVFGIAAVALAVGACSSNTVGYQGESAADPSVAEAPVVIENEDADLAGFDEAPVPDLLDSSPDGLPPESLAYVDDADDLGDAEEPYVWNGFLGDGDTVVSSSGRILVTCGQRGIDVEVDGAELVNVVVSSDGVDEFFGGLSGSVFSTPGEIDTIWVRIVGEDPGESPDGPGYGERFDC